MTDTARTLAAVKALFADNGAGAISAQDARDLIESIVNAVPGGGFDEPRATVAEQIFVSHFGANLSIPNGTSFRGPNFLDGAATRVDPMSGFQTGTYHSTYLGEDYAAGTWFRLPAGVWAIDTFGVWDANNVGERIVEIIHVDSRLMLSGDTLNPIFGSPNQWQMLSTAVYIPAANLPVNRSMGTHAIFIITPEMIATDHADSPAGSGWAMTLQVYQTSGSTRTLPSYAVIGARIG